jgi:hypothetical protein
MLENCLEGATISLDLKSKRFEFQYQVAQQIPSDDEFNTAVKRLEDLLEIIVLATSLVNYLAHEGYVTIYSSVGGVDDKIEFGRRDIDKPTVSLEMPDQEIIDLFISYVNRQFIPSQELHELEKNNFISKSELQFIKQLRATWIAIIVSFLLGFAGILFGIYNTTIREQSNKDRIMIENNFLEKLPEELQKIWSAAEENAREFEELNSKVDELIKHIVKINSEKSETNSTETQ